MPIGSGCGTSCSGIGRPKAPGVKRRPTSGRPVCVERVSGIKVRLPTWVELRGEQNVPEGERPFVRVARKGTYRLQVVCSSCHTGCYGQPLAIFSALRAPARELFDQNDPFKLADNVTAWLSDAGCGPPGPTGGNWGPVYCGNDVVVWHYKGIDYAIESNGATESDLRRWADESIRFTSG
jgi:hypothetical protein